MLHPTSFSPECVDLSGSSTPGWLNVVKPREVNPSGVKINILLQHFKPLNAEKMVFDILCGNAVFLLRKWY